MGKGARQQAKGQGGGSLPLPMLVACPLAFAWCCWQRHRGAALTTLCPPHPHPHHHCRTKPQDLHHPAMRERHWKMLMQTTGKHFVMDDRFCLGDLLALELHNYVDACSEIVDRCAAPCPTAPLACIWLACREAKAAGPHVLPITSR